MTDKLHVVNSTELENATNEMKNELTITGDMTVGTVLDAVSGIPAIKTEDMKFLVEHKDHLGMITEKTFQWRTNSQKRSIVNDIQHPTIHGKFHQAILEQKVQFQQGMYLAKDYRMKQLDIREKQEDINDLLDEIGDGIPTARQTIKMDRFQTELSFMQYELEEMYISEGYRMEEVKGWQTIIDKCLDIMRNEMHMDEEKIWDRDSGEVEEMFFAWMTKVNDIPRTTDPAAANNIFSLAAFAYHEAKEMNMLEDLLLRCNPVQMSGVRLVQSELRKNGIAV